LNGFGMSNASLVPKERIEGRILLIRGQKVLLDRDLAELYGVETKALNQAVKRNIERFPADFMFRLSGDEKSELVTKCDRFDTLKHSTALPNAFTEQGVAMLSSVLKSKQAVEVNIAIMRTFVQLRKMLESHKELARKLEDLESQYDKQFRIVFDALRELMTPPEPKKNPIGFHVREEVEKYSTKAG